jgi:hypothetical protein
MLNDSKAIGLTICFCDLNKKGKRKKKNGKRKEGQLLREKV